MNSIVPATEVTRRRREYAVSVYVFNRSLNRLYFIQRKKPPFLGWYLPPGGHVEPGETPDEAAVREVREETGYAVRLLDDSDVDESPEKDVTVLTRPLRIQLEKIDDQHDHVDLIYCAVITGSELAQEHADERGEWMDAADVGRKEMPANVRHMALQLFSKYLVNL